MPSSHPLVERFRTGGVPPHLKSAAARGALPLPAEDLLEILFHLRRETDRELQREIVATLEGMPIEVVLQVAASADTEPAMLDFLARASIRRDTVLEPIVRNPATADATLQLVAQHGTESILEMLSFNQVRLTRTPSILQAMLGNARLTTTLRRRLKEIWDLHQQDVARGASAPAPKPVLVPEPLLATPAPPASMPTPPVDALPSAPPSPGHVGEAEGEGILDEAGLTDDGLPVEGAEGLDDLAGIGLDERILEEMAADDATEEELRLAQRLLTMNVPEKVQLALKGGREARMVLIRDASKQVQEAVINSPKITENEIERIANMRSVGEDVIRMLSNKREVMKNYAVVHNLVRNPKTPQPVAIQLMSRLQNRDLQHIMKDKNIADVVRRHAGITLDKRAPKKTPAKGKK